MQKTLIFALVGALAISLIGGMFSVPTAEAASGTLSCTPSVQYISSGQWVGFSAQYQYGDTPSTTLSWSAIGGSPATGTGQTFGTQFWTSSLNETRVVTVSDGSQVAVCMVYVNGSSVTPTPQAVTISPASKTVYSGENITFTAWGGNGTFTWSAAGGTPATGWGSSFTTHFSNNGPNAIFQEVRVTSGTASAYAWVTILPLASPTPTPGGAVSVDHTVYNSTRGGNDASWISAFNGDRLRFTVRITTGNQYAYDVHVRDWLPQYVTYVPGSTTLDGVWYSDGVATGGSNDSLALGVLSPNRTYVLRFEGTVSGAPNSALTNSVNVHAQGFSDQNRTTTITVSGNVVTPTPTPIIGGNGIFATSIAGRNVSRGQSGEHASLSARGGDTLDLILHIRSQNGQYLSNVIVSDALPVGILYIPGSTTLNGVVQSDGITTSGLNIGSLAPWQEAVVKFSVRVDTAFVPTVGTVKTINTVQVRADGTGSVASSVAIALGMTQFLTGAAGVQTGPVDSLLMALLSAIVAAGVYAIYTRTGAFHRRIVASEIQTLARKPINFVR